MFVLTNSQLKVLSEIYRDIGQIAFASMVVSPFLIDIDRINWVIVVSGLLVSVFCWLYSLSLVKNLKL